MELYAVMDSVIQSMHNTPYTVAIFTDGKHIKVFEKAFYRNTLNRPNWFRNTILERLGTPEKVVKRLGGIGVKKGGSN